MDQIVKGRAWGAPVERWSDGAAFRAISGKANIGSILVIKVDHIGDFILSLEALAVLRDAFPNVQLDLLCAPWNEHLARSLGLFDNIHTLAFFNVRADGEQPKDRSAILEQLPGHDWDLAIDLRVDRDTRILLRHVKARYRVGFECASESDILTVSLPISAINQASQNVGMHQSMLMLRLARTTVDLFCRGDHVKRLLLGRVAEPADVDLSAAQGRILVACNTSSGRQVKNWPAVYFRRLIHWLVNDMDAVVLLLGSADQQSEADEIIRYCGSSNVISAVGRTSFNQAVSLVGQASVFVGNDSALTHVAGRLDVPTVVLMSGIDPTVMWAALGESVTILRVPVPCSPCHIAHMEDCRSDHACMRNLTESMVRSALRKALLTASRYGQPNARRTTQNLRLHPSYRGWVTANSRQIPQRYSENRHRYTARRGELQLEQLMQGFVHSSTNNRGDLNRFYTLALVFDQILKEKICGDIAELGVYKGNTAFMLASLARQIGATVYLLDTFEGFAEADLTGVEADKDKQFADTSVAQVSLLVGKSNVCFVQGYFPDTSDQIPPEARFCLVHLDCDLYAPLKAALHFFYDRMVPGGFLIMHDYSSLHWDGAERAVDEFFADKPESILPVPDASGTVFVRKSKPKERFANWFVQSSSSGFANSWVYANSTDVKVNLAQGWSLPETWGTWGLGSCHTLALILTQMPTCGLELAAETTAVLVPGAREHLSVEVVVNGHSLACWDYDLDRNTGVRTVVIPQDNVKLQDGLPILNVEFRPSAFDSPQSLDPGIPDSRPLGMGLIRFRQRQFLPGEI